MTLLSTVNSNKVYYLQEIAKKLLSTGDSKSEADLRGKVLLAAFSRGPSVA